MYEGYTDEYMPIGGYAVLLAVYTGAALGFLSVGGSRGTLPRQVAVTDVVLTGVATHKLSRVITKDWVMIPLRAPFTEYRASAGSGEMSERSRGRGLRRALGDLLTCPWCIGPWVAGALVGGLAVAPRATRMVTATFTAVAVSDFLHHAYDRVQP